MYNCFWEESSGVFFLWEELEVLRVKKIGQSPAFKNNNWEESPVLKTNNWEESPVFKKKKN